MAFYEIVFIIRPDVATQQVEQLTSRMSEVVTKNGGSIIKNEQWGLRNLAYRIKKYKKGYYVMLGAEMPGEKLAEVERNLNLSEDIIRHQAIRVPVLDDKPSVMMKFNTPREDYAPRPSA